MIKILVCMVKGHTFESVPTDWRPIKVRCDRCGKWFNLK